MPANGSLEQRMDEMRMDVRDMRSAMTQIADAISKLAVLEERHQGFSENTQRRLTQVEARAEATHIEQVRFAATIDGINKTMRLMWTAFGAGVIYLGGKLIQILTSAP